MHFSPGPGNSTTESKILTLAVLAAAAAAASLPMPPVLALLAGAGLSRLGTPPAWSRRAATVLLTASIALLGLGIDLDAIVTLGIRGVLLTAATLGLTLGLGWALGRRLGIPRDLSWLIAAGTGVCGGSAIAALAPTLRARPQEVSAALTVVFCLNAAALLLFPAVGGALDMNGPAFGTWCALAVHDTSSVIGAASTHGAEAVTVATTTKLTRALWILPLGLSLAWARRRETARSAGTGHATPSLPLPWALLGFVATASLMVLCPGLRDSGEALAQLAGPGMRAALFFLGLGLTRAALGGVSRRLWGLAGTLWLALSLVSLWVVVAS